MTMALTRRRPSTDSGWTLIELLVVISLILILATMALAQYRNSVTSAKEATLRSQLFIMRDAIDQYYADKGRYPDSLQTLVSDHYLRSVPRDPFTGNSESWQTVPAEPETGTVSAAAGIFDVKSGYDGSGLDGSRIADW